MKKYRIRFPLLLAVSLLGLSAPAQTYVTPMMGGGQVAADMVHIDLFYDSGARQLLAQVDDSFGTPELRALDPGLAFDPQAAYAVLSGKVYNAQYGWNVGGLFALPPGAAIWIELLDCTPGLETYSGWGRLASYTPIFGTADSSRLWKWSGVMVHNTFAFSNPPITRLFAEYHIYLGDANTGARANFMDLGDTTVRLKWTTVPVENPATFRFGAVAETNGAPLCFLNQDGFITNSESVVNLHYTSSGPCAQWYQGCIPMLVVPAGADNGGPVDGHAALGSRLELQLVSLNGPPQGKLGFWEPGESQPRALLSVGETNGTNRFQLSQNNGAPTDDPYGFVQGRSLAVNQPGLYCLGFKLVDSSTNGPGGGAIHSVSPLYNIFLQAGFMIRSLSRAGASATVSFGGEDGKSFYLERSSVLGPAASWQTVAGPLAGASRLQTLTDQAATGSPAFFRLRVQ